MSVSKSAISLGCLWLGVIAIGYWALPGKAQGVIGADRPSDSIESHNSLAKQFKAGKTNNVPLLRMDWFSDPDSPSPGYYRVHWFSLGPSGQASMGMSSFSNGSFWPPKFDKAQLLSVFKAIDKLPKPTQEILPYERQIVISGVRSNQWFHAVYDRAKIPLEVTELFKISGADLKAYKQ